MVKGDTWRFAKGYQREAVWAVAVSLGLNLLLAVAGAFGSYLTIPLPQRLAHWLIAGGLNLALNLIVWFAVMRRWFKGPPPLLGALAMSLVLAAPGAVMVWASLAVFAPKVLPYIAWGELYAQTAFINLLINGALALALRPRGHGGREPDEPAPAANAVFAASDSLLNRLPEGLRRAPILALSAEDHYVRVTTTAGDALILHRFQEAVAAMGDGAGVQVHRSHWVAPAAVARLERREGRTTAHLHNGRAIPVARKRARTLAERLKG